MSHKPIYTPSKRDKLMSRLSGSDKLILKGYTTREAQAEVGRIEARLREDRELLPWWSRG